MYNFFDFIDVEYSTVDVFLGLLGFDFGFNQFKVFLRKQLGIGSLRYRNRYIYLEIYPTEVGRIKKNISKRC